MTQELRSRNQASSLYVRALASAWRSRIELNDPSLWLLKEPELEEKMLRDADIAHAVGYRRHLIAGRQWTVQPRQEGADRSDVACEVANQLLQDIQSFTQSRMNLARAFFSGARFARIRGCMKERNFGDGKMRRWWVPVALEDHDKRLYRIVPDPKRQTSDNPFAVQWHIFDIIENDWRPMTAEESCCTIRHVYQDDQASLGHGRGLREALAWWWYAKEHVFSESLQAIERFAQGIVTAKVDGIRDAATGLPNTELINAWKNVLEDLRGRHVLVHDSSDEVQTISGSSEGWQMLSTMREELRSTIFTLILGANLTTAANSGGSYALAEIQENSTEALIQFDREALEETLTRRLIGAVWKKNWANLTELGVQHQQPRFSIVQDKRLDPQQRIAVAEGLNRMGVELSLQDVLEQTGFRMPEKGETVVQAGSMAQPSMPMIDLPSLEQEPAASEEPA